MPFRVGRQKANCTTVRDCPCSSISAGSSGPPWTGRRQSEVFTRSRPYSRNRPSSENCAPKRRLRRDLLLQTAVAPHPPRLRGPAAS